MMRFMILVAFTCILHHNTCAIYPEAIFEKDVRMVVDDDRNHVESDLDEPGDYLNDKPNRSKENENENSDNDIIKKLQTWSMLSVPNDIEGIQGSCSKRTISRSLHDSSFSSKGIEISTKYPLCGGLCEYDSSKRYLKCSGKNKSNMKLGRVLKCIPDPVLLNTLELSHFNFGTIPNSSFKDIYNLQMLSIKESNVTKLDSNAFKGLSKLLVLELFDTGTGKTGISHLSRYSFQHCIELRQLAIGKVLNMDNDTFGALPKLRIVYVVDRSLLDHHNVLGSVQSLTKLIMPNIGLRNMPFFTISNESRYHHFDELNLANNKINILALRQPLQTSEPLEIIINNNKLKNVTKSDMSQFKTAASLSIDFSNNDIRMIEPNFLQDIKEIGALRFAHNTNFRYKNFKTLMLSLRKKPIKVLNLIGCGIVFWQFDATTLGSLQLSNLEKFYIGDNIIKDLEADAFTPVASLKLLYISNFMRFSRRFLSPLQDLEELLIDSTIDQTITAADRQMIDLNELKKLKALQVTNLDARLISLRFENLDLEYIVFKDMKESFDFYLENIKIVMKKRKAKLNRIDLGGNLMFRYNDEILCELFSNINSTLLSLTDNYFSGLPTCTFQKSTISKLILKRNRITHIHEGLFDNIQSLFFIDLSENALQLIDRNAFTHFFQNPTIKPEILIQGNKLKCDCKMKPFITWLQQKQTNIVVIHDKYCSSPKWRTKEELMNVRITWIECNKELFLSICVTSGIALSVMIILAGSLLKVYLNDMKYKQLVRRARKHNMENQIERNDSNEEFYDAFVSYHPEKRIWVNGALKNELMKGDIQFTLMLTVTQVNNPQESQESDFNGILTLMARCCHVIFLVSRGWIKEGMNEFEMKAAVDVIKHSKRHTLIVILMENIPKMEMPETLQLMVRNNICLKWSENEREQRKFWRDLKLELGKEKYK